MLLAVAQQVPSFGGMYIEGERLMVLMTESPSTETLTNAQATVARILARPDLMRLRPVAVKARYSFAQLKSWYDRLSPKVLSLPGVVLTDINDIHNCVDVGVEDVVANSPGVRKTALDLQVPLPAIRIEKAGAARFD